LRTEAFAAVLPVGVGFGEMRRFVSVLGCAAWVLCCLAATSPADELPKGVHFGVGFENGGHETVGPYKLKTFIRLDDQFGAGERIQLSTTHAGGVDELRGVAVVYEQPFLTNWRATLAAARSVTQPGGLIGQFFDQDTQDYALSGSLNYILRPAPGLAALLSVGLSSADSETTRTAKGFGLLDEKFDQRTQDLIASVGVRYDLSSDTGITGSLAVAQGLDWNPAHIRVNADDTATVLRYSAALTQNLPLSFQIMLSASGQWSASRVTETRLFTLGRWEPAMGYPAAERLGDIGAGARVELNHLGVVALPDSLGKLYYKPFVFVDGAFTRFNDPVGVEATGNQTKSSAGVGLAIQTTGGIHAAVQVAHPLSGASIFDAHERGARVLFSVGFSK
jgi:hemolysin activation/secretion protein